MSASSPPPVTSSHPQLAVLVTSKRVSGPGDRIARGLDDLVAGRDRRLLEERRGPHVRERRRQATADLRIGRS